MSLKKAMDAILKTVEAKEVVYRTKRGIKGIIADLAKKATLDVSYDYLLAEYGREVLTSSSLRRQYYEPYKRFSLDVLRGAV